MTAAAPADATSLKNMQQLIQLRWLAVAGQVVTIAVVHFGVGIPLPLAPMAGVLAALLVFNAASVWRVGAQREVTAHELFVALLIDVGMLTAQLYLSGGATNPFVFLYLLQVILGAVLLGPRQTWTVLAVACGCFAGLALLSEPLALPPDLHLGLHSRYIQGMLICFALNAALLVMLITRIQRNLRTREARLADLRQRATEHEHIVRMGLLASGAAHELGTPLSTMSVILGDWRRMRPVVDTPALLQEVRDMELQLKRCKSIVSGILLSAGEARGESAVMTTLSSFLDTLVDEWRRTRTVVELDYSNAIGEDVAIVSDSTLKQMIANVLDNALEASPAWVGLDARRTDDRLVLTVRDMGPGFPPGMLERLGTPYQSTKGRPGSGLGLFLSLNVARTLNGSLDARNRPEGGAEVTLTLPLAAITLDDKRGVVNRG